MQLNSKKELRQQRIEKALRSNLKKRKIFQNKINKKAKKPLIGTKRRWLTETMSQRHFHTKQKKLI